MEIEITAQSQFGRISRARIVLRVFNLAFRLFLSFITLGALGCTSSAPPNSSHDSSSAENSSAISVDDALVQFSLVAALAAGDYVEGLPLRRVLDSGDFGVGTYSRLDGEMIVLDGKIYQALADGTVRRPGEDETTPFAAVKFFSADGTIDNVQASTLDHLDEQLDLLLPHRNTPCAMRIDGEFPELTLRSVAAQRQPFPLLVDAVKQQVVWRHENVRGTLIGLRCPAWIGKINVAGYHWHFISDDRQIAGHVLACKVASAVLQYDTCKSLVVRLPDSARFDEFDEQQVKARDIDEIERQRPSP